MSRVPEKLLRLTLSLALGLTAAGAAFAQHPFKPVKPPASTAKVTPSSPAHVAVMVELFDTPAAIDYAAKLADTTVSKERALANARAAARAKVALLGPLHDQLAAQLKAAPIGAQELFRLKKAMNAVAVWVEPSRIAAIKAAVGIPLTLHGGSGTDDADFSRAIAAGINIIHINTELRVAWRQSLDKSLADHPNEVVPYKILPPVVDAIRQVALSRLRLFNNL